MVLTALRGALGFLSRLPVGQDRGAWEAFRRTPAAFTLAGYVIGALLAVPFVLPVPASVGAVLFLGVTYGVTGVNHVDGLADLGDAAAVHGAEKRRAVMKDTTVGVGAVLAVGLGVAGLALAGLGLARLPIVAALSAVVASEVGAKLGMAALAAVGSPAHDGLGAALVDQTVGGFAVALLLAVPAVALARPTVVGAGSVSAGLVTALGVGWWARSWLDGISGDVFGAANELARVVALHAGVVAWTLS
ncbi:adenosylcobinamide-GDP ribazoletransferase [Halomicrococcus sp. NG-SE-24]|uniref:adenosylcobinamide-GDP ribazoletransferase n=1 Tax=Halomicrococcus sp. NG-SE-24 TaxID=3436928 RepID=UPI003D965D22